MKRPVNAFSAVMKTLTTLILCLIVSLCIGQVQSGGFYAEPDTVPDVDLEYVPKIKAKIFAGRPGRAALYSLILPGAGQAYNKKYWQVPIVWAGVGTAGGIMVFNVNEYKGYREAYRERLIAEMEMRPPTDEYVDVYSTQSLLNLRDQYNRFRQISIFAFALTWIANSAQAYVGAHLKDFDISDDLSIEFIPMGGNEWVHTATPLTTGIVLRF